MNVTELIAKNIEINLKDIEKDIENVKAQCCMCGKEYTEAIKIKKILSEHFTNYEYFKYKTDYMCLNCAKCLKDDRLRKNNFIADKNKIILFKQNEIEKYIYEMEKYVSTPFVFAVTRSFKKHNSFKCKLNYDYKYFYIQEEDKKYIFDVEKMKKLYEILNEAYLHFTKDEMITGIYKFASIEKYGIDNFIKLENILKEYRGTHKFNLLIYMLNSEKRNEYIKTKKEEEKKWKNMEKEQENVQLQLW